MCECFALPLQARQRFRHFKSRTNCGAVKRAVQADDRAGQVLSDAADIGRMIVRTSMLCTIYDLSGPHISVMPKLMSIMACVAMSPSRRVSFCNG